MFATIRKLPLVASNPVIGNGEPATRLSVPSPFKRYSSVGCAGVYAIDENKCSMGRGVGVGPGPGGVGEGLGSGVGVAVGWVMCWSLHFHTRQGVRS